MGITHKNNCNSNLAQPEIGSCVYTTNDANVNGEDTQLTTAWAEKIAIPTAEAAMNSIGTMVLKVRLDFTADSSGFKSLAGKINNNFGIGVAGDWQLTKHGTTVDQNKLGLFMPGIIAASGVTWEDAAIGGMCNDSSLHEIRLLVDNTTPIIGGSHVVCYLDGELLPIVANDVTSGWSATTNTHEIYLPHAQHDTSANWGGPQYIDSIEFYDTIELPVPPGPGITIDNSDLLIHPYDANLVADIPVSGGYTNYQPTANGIAYQVYEEVSTDVVPINGNEWNPLVSPSISTIVDFAGTYTGIAADVPKTKAMLRIRTRYTYDGTTATADQTLDTGVGFLMPFIGQSNPFNFFQSSLESPNALSFIMRKGSTTGRDWIAAAGSAGIPIANQLVESLGCPVGLMDYAVGSASLEYKNNITDYWYTLTTPSAMYTDFRTGIDAVGGNVHAVYIWEGETDTADPSTFSASLVDFLNNQLRVHVGYAGTGVLPIHVGLIGNWDSGTDENLDLVNMAYMDAYDAGHIQRVTSCNDQDFSDGAHLDPAGRAAVAPRIARQVEVQEGVHTTGKQPRVLGITLIDSVTTDFIIELDYGSDIVATTNSFEVNIGSIGTPNWVAVSGARLDANTVRGTHTTGTVVEARCLFGAPPLTTDILTDDLLLPVLQESGLEIVESGTDTTVENMIVVTHFEGPTIATATPAEVTVEDMIVATFFTGPSISNKVIAGIISINITVET